MASPTILLWYWGRRGGGAKDTRQLAKALQRALGRGRVAIAVSTDNELLDDYRALGETLKLSPPAWRGAMSVGERLSRLVDLVRFAAEVRRSPYRTVVVTMNFPFAWPLVGFLRRGGRKIVYICHDAAPHPGDFMRAWQSLSQAALMRSVDRVVVLSEAVRRDCLARYGPRLAVRIGVVPIQALYADARTLPEAPSPSEPIRFLFAGRLLAYKGLDLLAGAAGLLAQRTDWTLTIAGEGPCEAQVREAFAGLPHCTFRPGWLSERAYEAILEEHHVLVCPYTEASQSGLLPDALVRGVPGIVTPVGGLPEQIGFGKAGLVADGVSPQTLAAAMTALLDDRGLLARLREGARELAAPAVAPEDWIEALLSAAERTAPR